MVSRTAIQLSLVVALCIIGLVSCNNWQGYQSRSTSQSSTEWPFVPKIGNTPHYQVGLGQNFTMSWSVGHGNNAALYGLSSYTYVVIMKFDDQHFIPGTQNGMMALINQYINQASMYSSTAGFTDLTNAPGWHRVQLLPNQYTKTGGKNGAFWTPQVGLQVTGNGGYNDTIPSLWDYYENGPLKGGIQYGPTDPKYINIDPALFASKTGCRGGGSFCGTGTNFMPPGQWVHNAAYDSHNVRLEYDNPHIPWIISVSKFQISVAPTDYTNTYNAAWFRVPARKGAGNYMAWYIWAGYSDVTDVNVMPSSTPVASPYLGNKGATGSTYTRVDHCEMNFMTNSVIGCKKVDPNTMDISACVAACSANGGCNGIQVSRASNLPSTYTLPDGTTKSYSTPVNIPFVAWNMSQISMTNSNMATGPCGFYTVPLRTRAGCKSTTNDMLPGVNPTSQRCIAADFAPTDYVCFGINFNQADNTTLQATPPFSAASEPQDPRFYSSCVLKAQTYGFDPATYPPYPSAKPKWQAASSCVPCTFLDKVNTMNTFNNTFAKVPNWEKVTLSPNGCAPCY